MKINEESTAFGFFTFKETKGMAILANSVQRIADAFANRQEAVIR